MDNKEWDEKLAYDLAYITADNNKENVVKEVWKIIEKDRKHQRDLIKEKLEGKDD